VLQVHLATVNDPRVPPPPRTSPSSRFRRSHRRPASRVSPYLRHLVRRHPGVPLVLADSTLQLASRHRATGERVITPSRAQTVRGDRIVSVSDARVPRRRQQAVFPLDRAAKPRPMWLFGHCVWQAAAPRGL
jgi:hypothetical protein